MTIQDSIANSPTVEALRANRDALVENVIEPTKDELIQAATRAREAAADMTRKVQDRAEKLSGAAVERGTEIASDLSHAASHNLRAADTGLRDLARRHPEVLILGGALVGIGLAMWLRSSRSAS